MNTITPTILEAINNVFGEAESKIEEITNMVSDLLLIRNEIENTVDSRYTTMFSRYVENLDKTIVEVTNRLYNSIDEVEYAIDNNRLKTADNFYTEVISPHNESMVEFYGNFGSLEEFKAYIKEYDPLAFDDEEDLEAFWKFGVEGRYYEKYKTYRDD